MTAELVPADDDFTDATLDELADIANAEASEMAAALVSSLSHAIRCGSALLLAYERVPRSDWLAWCASRLTFTQQHAGMLMRLAHYRDQLPAEVFRPRTNAVGQTRFPTWTTTYASYVRGLPPLRDPMEHRRQDEATVAEARRLCRAGLSAEAAAALLGVSEGAVYRWANPDKAAQYKRTEKAKRRRARAERIAGDERKSRNLLARQRKGDLPKAYGHVRTLLSTLGRAVTAAPPSARQSIHDALTAAARAEDAIVAAMKEIK